MSDDYQFLELNNVHEMCACYHKALLVKILTLCNTVQGASKRVPIGWSLLRQIKHVVVRLTEHILMQKNNEVKVH